MWNHESVWGAIDALAARHGLSPSGLAKKAGLDRDRLQPLQAPRQRRAAALAIDGIDRQGSRRDRRVARGFRRAGARRNPTAAGRKRRSSGVARTPVCVGFRPVPLLGFAQAGAGGFFDDGGFPAGPGLGRDRFSGPRRRVRLCAEGHRRFHAAALSRRRHHHRLADRAIRRGDRVVVKTTDGEVMAKILKRQSASEMELASFNPEHPTASLPARDVDWMARILWASQ